AIPLDDRSRKTERPLHLTTNRRVHGEGSAHVHGVADSFADYRVRPVNAPGETITSGSGENLVLLCVVKILDVQPTLILPERCLRQVSLSVGFERPKVMLEPRHEGDVPNGGCWTKGIEKVAHHCTVHTDIFGLARLSSPRADENMGRPHACDCRRE